jgi:hypothetical protein
VEKRREKAHRAALVQAAAKVAAEAANDATVATKVAVMAMEEAKKRCKCTQDRAKDQALEISGIERAQDADMNNVHKLQTGDIVSASQVSRDVQVAAAIATKERRAPRAEWEASPVKMGVVYTGRQERRQLGVHQGGGGLV